MVIKITRCFCIMKNKKQQQQNIHEDNAKKKTKKVSFLLDKQTETRLDESSSYVATPSEDYTDSLAFTEESSTEAKEKSKKTRQPRKTSQLENLLTSNAKNGRNLFIHMQDLDKNKKRMHRLFEFEPDKPKLKSRPPRKRISNDAAVDNSSKDGYWQNFDNLEPDQKNRTEKQVLSKYWLFTDVRSEKKKYKITNNITYLAWKEFKNPISANCVIDGVIGFKQQCRIKSVKQFLGNTGFAYPTLIPYEAADFLKTFEGLDGELGSKPKKYTSVRSDTEEELLKEIAGHVRNGLRFFQIVLKIGSKVYKHESFVHDMIKNIHYDNGDEKLDTDYEADVTNKHEQYVKKQSIQINEIRENNFIDINEIRENNKIDEGLICDKLYNHPIANTYLEITRPDVNGPHLKPEFIIENNGVQETVIPKDVNEVGITVASLTTRRTDTGVQEFEKKD